MIFKKISKSVKTNKISKNTMKGAKIIQHQISNSGTRDPMSDRSYSRSSLFWGLCGYQLIIEEKVRCRYQAECVGSGILAAVYSASGILGV
jgi:hypothetical protein